ncbi:zinc finger BED domain-containing protein 4-like [Thrips palmi]|uniref:Zinc finger BED domain-containing protein 4-like n=1 Tax=Thrips palmi TaxID=161013 RepID=A0A6P9AB34_THRPL|nr:zinc finger BED domain-containing protein 4-like [Thrips palmi]
MESKYEILAGVVREKLREAPSLCLTADNWTESHSTSGYLGVTVHYGEGVQMESLVIGLIRLMERHTGVYLGDKMLECCTDWAIDPLRVTACITDNAENIKLAVKLTFGSSKVLPCFDHTLNLVPKVALFEKDKNQQPHVPGVAELLKKVKEVVTLSHCSSNFSDEIKKIQMEQFGKSEGTTLRLLQDVPTRWGSTYLMLERWMELRPVVVLAASKFPAVNMPNAAEQQTLQSILDLLKPFHEATKEMGAEKTTTLSKCIPMYHLLLKAVNAVPAEGDIASRLKTFLSGELLRRFGGIETNKMVAAATILDPRFIKHYFQSPLAAADAVAYIEEQVKQELLLNLTDDTAAADNDTSAGESDAVAGNAGGGLWSSHAELVASSREGRTRTGNDIPAQARAEVRGYLGREIVSMDKNPLEVWEKLKIQYPGMYPVARRLLTTLATSVSMERGFSIAGDIADDKGNRITSTHLRQRLFLKTVPTKFWEAARLKK